MYVFAFQRRFSATEVKLLHNSQGFDNNGASTAKFEFEFEFACHMLEAFGGLGSRMSELGEGARVDFESNTGFPRAGVRVA